MTPFDRLGVWILTQRIKRLNRLIRQLQETDPMSPQMTAALAALTAASANVSNYVTTLQGNQDDSAAVDQINADAKNLNALVPLAVSPATLTSPVGQAVSQSLAISGGNAPYAATSSSPDVTATVNGSTVELSGTPAAAEDVTITVTDSSPTQKQATSVLTVA